MRRLLSVLTLILMSTVISYSKDIDISKVRWAPTMDDVFNEQGINSLIFFTENKMAPGRRTFERLEETGRITDEEKIETVLEAIGDANHCEYDYQCARNWQTWLGVVNNNKEGFLINFGWDHDEEKAEWWGTYSHALYDLLVQYQIIETPEKPVFINEPNAVRLQTPPKESLARKPKVITTHRESNLDQMYIAVDPNETPVYVQLDPNAPKVYIAVDPNLAAIKELMPVLDAMESYSNELLAQNRWLRDVLDEFLPKLKAEKSVKAIPNEATDSNLPYLVPETRTFSEINDIYKLKALLSLKCAAMNASLYSSRDFIKTSEKRLEHFREHSADSNDTNNASTEPQV